MESCQVTLFAKKEDVEQVFAGGEIVIQTWAWVGNYDVIYPYWQVRFSEVRGNRGYCCHSVPYGSTFELRWFGRGDIKTTGLTWKIPSWDELRKWHKRQGRGNEYIKSLSIDEGSWYPPLKEEKELVDMLNTLGVDYREVTRDNFDEKMRGLLK